MSKLGLILSTITVGLGFAVSASQGQTPAAGGDAKAGKDLFVKYTCYGCHGFSGQNGPGFRLVPMKMTQANFTSLVRNPGALTRMPPYSAKVITDAQLADIW